MRSFIAILTLASLIACNSSAPADTDDDQLNIATARCNDLDRTNGEAHDIIGYSSVGLDDPIVFLTSGALWLYGDASDLTLVPNASNPDWRPVFYGGVCPSDYRVFVLYW